MNPKTSFLLSLGLLLTACTASFDQIARSDIEGVPEHAINGGRYCRMPDFELVDARAQTGLTRIDGREVTFPDLPHWLRDALESAIETDPDLPHLSIELSRAYLERHPTGSDFHLVLRVRTDQTQDWRVYRADAGGPITFIGAKQFGSQMRRSATKALGALVEREARCTPQR